MVKARKAEGEIAVILAVGQQCSSQAMGRSSDLHLISRSLYTSDTGDDAPAADPEIQFVPEKPKKPRHFAP